MRAGLLSKVPFPKISKLLRPGTALLKQSVKLYFSSYKAATVRGLLAQLAEPPTFVFPDQHARWRMTPVGACPFRLCCDASICGFGATSEQAQGDEPRTMETIVNASRATLSDSERHWHQLELEGGVIVWAIKSFHGYLETDPFHVLTDQESLDHMYKVADHDHSGAALA